MQQRAQSGTQPKRQHHFTASEVAEFEYCPLIWWHEQFEPHAREDDEDLFAHMVELEHEHGPQAPALPEYQVIEQLLLRRGAFEEGKQQHRDHAEEVEELEEERVTAARATGRTRALALIAAVIVLLALLLIGIAIVLR